MFKSNKKSSGFTLIELMITVAIVAILAAIAIPMYADYTRKARITEFTTEIAKYKISVATCYSDTGVLADCDGGTNGVLANQSTATTTITSITVLNGVIALVPVAKDGLVAGDTVIATPTADASGKLQWAYSGGAVTNGYLSN